MNQRNQPILEASRLQLGATYLGEGRCSFEVWAPNAKIVELHQVSPNDRILPLRSERGYHRATFEKVAPGARYFLRLDNTIERPDPVSRFQPEGVHGPSEVIDSYFEWTDSDWFGLPLRDYIIYELHVGTFTQEGTFAAIIPYLPELKELGITAIELMPVAQFPGDRNWGYDGVDLFAVQNSYGGPNELKRLVNACHQVGLAVILDVVYNHLGPEGNYLRDFGNYFSEDYHTFWGPALNFDGPDSDEVRRFFLENALHWQTDFHMDALRLDAIHAIRDASAFPFLQELSQITQRRSEMLNRRFHLIGESDLNNPRVILPGNLGGYGLDAQWSDDFHHCLHVLLTGEKNGYYADFCGIKRLEKFFREGYTYTGEYSLTRRRRHGLPPKLNQAKQFVVFSQNHDQIGNRMLGDRLANLCSFEDLKLAAGCVLLSPFIPLLFMGEEYGERAPFQYFISHTDRGLVEAVQKGRREEFANFVWEGEVPDPQAESTFNACKLNHRLRTHESHQNLYDLYRELIEIRKSVPAITNAEKDSLEAQASESQNVLFVRYYTPDDEICLLFCFAQELTTCTWEIPIGGWQNILDSAMERWNGKGSKVPHEIRSNGRLTITLSPKSFVVLRRIKQT
ncbi:malto-oligosyltrehalose trehalohydrolase [Pedosphaera parvula]|uniref:Malto-oligosyltrehalose trehalohydrolase n=1 Tax=Pedosphaera parvula (strain Ellin514) TaxID=320771 RepID=B9XNC5_PEDPL|nr:malto-oligosyltrehalose trehalohydrolase [Pedosphaera parvula]EEF58678.1 malto-oligosyltrehalose trehalohydrolase [Pedosphaera parvula Ellin514]